MSDAKPKGPAIARGKVRAFYVLPEKLAERIVILAARERKRPSYVAERLLQRGLEAERGDGRGSKASQVASA